MTDPDYAVLQAAIDALQDDLDTIGAAMASLEDLTASIWVGTIAASQTVHLWTAPFGASVESLSVVCQSVVARSDANAWTVRLRRHLGDGTYRTIAVKDTTLSGSPSEAIASTKDWNFDAIPFVDNLLAKGQTVSVQFSRTGTPADLIQVALTVRYRPA
jgi:hypothetical protein